jgi:hypothetical protein
MNRIERELQAHGGILNGRTWRTDRQRGCQISERRNGSFMPGHWTGKPRISTALDWAGIWRRRAMALPCTHEYERGVFLRRAREAILSGRESRLLNAGE